VGATYDMGHDFGHWTVQHRKDPVYIFFRPASYNTNWIGKGFLMRKKEAIRKGTANMTLITKPRLPGSTYDIPCIECRKPVTWCWPEKSSMVCEECLANPGQTVGPRQLSAPKNESTRLLEREKKERDRKEQLKLF